jgi:hypothetical protein
MQQFGSESRGNCELASEDVEALQYFLTLLPIATSIASDAKGQSQKHLRSLAVL